MGSKRVGLARTEALIENLKRDLKIGGCTANYWRWLTGDYSGLSLATKTDANCDSGFTFTANTFHETAGLGDATNALVLPKAVRDTLIVMKGTAAYDGGNDMTVTCASSDFFAAQTLNFLTVNTGDGGQNQRVFGTDFTTTQDLGKISTITAAHNTLTMSSTATNNQTAPGWELSFFCQNEGFWRIAFVGSETGSGVMNATFAGSTA